MLNLLNGNAVKASGVLFIFTRILRRTRKSCVRCKTFSYRFARRVTNKTVGTQQPITKLFDAGRDDTPYNENSFPGFDGHDQYIGLNTPLDQMYNDTKSKTSPNPMDTNWGGQSYTQNLVDGGYYAEDEVTKQQS